jgi:phosphopantothenoylcysteine decarboxylase
VTRARRDPSDDRGRVWDVCARPPDADAILAAPLPFNTINKWAVGISDTLALGLLNELLVDGPPSVPRAERQAGSTSSPAYAQTCDCSRELGVVAL